ncbi:MAG: molybdopterin oxidoreductase family protein [Campylobacterales bacterium]
MELIQSVCTYCGTGCDIVAEVENQTVQRLEAHPSGAVSRGRLCVKGKLGYQFLFSPNRIREARVSKRFVEKNRASFPEAIQTKLFLLHELDVDFYACDYDIAYDMAAWKLNELIQKHGPKTVGCVGGARTSSENGYFFQKFAREIIGTPHVDNCGRICHAPSLAGLKRTVGEGAATNPFDDIFDAEFLLVIGSNTTEAHPIVAQRVLEAARGGTPLAVMDVRRITLSKSARYELTIPYESNLLILNMMARVIVEEGLYNADFVRDRTANFDEYKAALLADKHSDPAFFKTVPGYETLAETIPEVARQYAKHRSLILWGLGVSEHIDGSDAVSAIAHLALLTGNVGKKGAGLMPLRGQNNVQGACDMGCLPYYLPGYAAPAETGLMTPQMMEAMLAGEMTALFNMGEDLAHVHANLHKVHGALGKLELLCVNELFPVEVAKKADIVFGVKSAYEKEGIYINAERRLHLSKPMMPCNLPDDWEVYAEIARRIGKPVAYRTHREIWADLRRDAPGHFAGADYEKLENAPQIGMQWPIFEGGTVRLHETDFRTEDGLGRFVFRGWQKRGHVAELQSAQSGFWLTTGRTLEHYNNAAQTKECEKLNRRYDEDEILISPEDAAGFDLSRPHLMKSATGQSRPLRLRADKGIRKGTLFCTFHHARSHINFLFGDESDSITMTPRYKAVKVTLEPE